MDSTSGCMGEIYFLKNKFFFSVTLMTYPESQKPKQLRLDIMLAFSFFYKPQILQDNDSCGGVPSIARLPMARIVGMLFMKERNGELLFPPKVKYLRT